MYAIWPADPPRLFHVSRHPEARIDDPDAFDIAGAEAQARSAAVTASAHDMLPAIPHFPRRSVGRSTLIIWSPAVLDPFPDIAEHVMEPEPVGQIGAHGGGMPVAVATTEDGSACAQSI